MKTDKFSEQSNSFKKEIKIMTNEDLYNAIISEAKKQGVSIDTFINETISIAMNLKKEGDKSDFDIALKQSFEKNKEILKKLADK